MPIDETSPEAPPSDSLAPEPGDEARDASAIRIPEGPAFFFRTDMPAWKYIVRMAVVSFVPTAILSMTLAATGVLTVGNSPQFEGMPPVVLFLGIFVFSPLIETLLMAGILRLLMMATRRPVRLAIASCIVWALLHSTMVPVWGLVIAWPFFVFSSAYLAWRRVSWSRGILVATSIHALHNLLPAIAVMLGGA